MEKVLFITHFLLPAVRGLDSSVDELGYFEGADGTEYCLIKRDAAEQFVRITNCSNAEIAIKVIKKVSQS